jgi:16S rRNA processing protein RimM
MAYKSNILLGRITKVSGYEGAVAVKLEKSFTENIPQMESVFLEIDGRPVPFFISGYDYSGADILKLSFEGYESEEKAGGFIGCRIFLTETGPDNSQKQGRTNSLLGYKVLLPDSNLLGTITDIVENPGQWLLIIESPAKKELLIPLHEDFIVSIDKKKKSVIMNIPEGLTDIN